MRNGDPTFSEQHLQPDVQVQRRAKAHPRTCFPVALVLSDVRVMVGEWIPFGRNPDRDAPTTGSGRSKRCQGGLFTSELDQHPTRHDAAR
ncbi:hypothetical protein PINS_up023065 [Pythium insidiosum]|nr:hypothetical protein PINS_up023065 [Pythium insidiosum]